MALTITTALEIGNQKEQVNFNGGTALANWSFTPSSPLSLHTRMQNVSVAELQQLGKTSYPLAGLLNGELFLSGSEQSLAGKGRVDVAQAVIANEPLNALTLDFNAERQNLQLTAQARSEAGTIALKGSYGLQSRRYQAEANTSGLKLEKIRALEQPPGTITGTLTASDTARVSARSKPPRVPSRSMLVSRISPAPHAHMRWAHCTASRRVARRPPWV